MEQVNTNELTGIYYDGNYYDKAYYGETIIVGNNLQASPTKIYHESNVLTPIILNSFYSPNVDFVLLENLTQTEVNNLPETNIFYIKGSEAKYGITGSSNLFDGKIVNSSDMYYDDTFKVGGYRFRLNTSSTDTFRIILLDSSYKYTSTNKNIYSSPEQHFGDFYIILPKPVKIPYKSTLNKTNFFYVPVYKN